MAGKLLEVGKLCKNFGGLATLSDVDLCLEEGEIRGLIGPNGAGRSSELLDNEHVREAYIGLG